MKGYIILAILIILLVVWSITQQTAVVYTPYGEYRVAAWFTDRHAAANLIMCTNTNFIKFLQYLRKKYKDHPDEDIRNIVQSILVNYNPEVIIENDPRFSTDTSYTVDKGRAIYLCLRQKTPPYKLVNDQVLMFVLLHEVGGHIGNYNGWQHTTRFWTIFKFILYEATIAGIYKPVDYAKHPAKYCGITIDYQPLYDNSLENMWMRH